MWMMKMEIVCVDMEVDMEVDVDWKLDGILDGMFLFLPSVLAYGDMTEVQMKLIVKKHERKSTKKIRTRKKNTESKRIVLTFATNRVWTNYVTPCRLSLLSQRFNSLQNKHLHRDMKKKPRVTEVSITKQPIFVVFDQCSPTYSS
jgi:hypothetical protein